MLRTRLLLPCIAALVALLAPPAHSDATTVITFDDLVGASSWAGGHALTNEYAAKGVLFSGPAANSGGAIMDLPAMEAGAAHSGPNTLGFFWSGTFAGGGEAQWPETISFAAPVSSVSTWAYSGTANMTMIAYDAGGNTLDTATIGAGFEWTQLSVAAAGIDHVVLSSSGTAMFVDDLEFGAIAGGAATPEPTTLLLMASGIALGALRCRRRTARRAAGSGRAPLPNAG